MLIMLPAESEETRREREYQEICARYHAQFPEFRAHVAQRRRSLRQEGMRHTDTIVTLEDNEFATHARLIVAHISACNWIDIFTDESETRKDRDGKETIEHRLRHVALTPSQAETLVAVYAAKVSVDAP